jgi:hypothetical protein
VTKKILTLTMLLANFMFCACCIGCIRPTFLPRPGPVSNEPFVTVDGWEYTITEQHAIGHGVPSAGLII